MHTPSDYHGTEPVTAKVNAEMKAYLDAKAEQHGDSRADVIRGMLAAYRQIDTGEIPCLHCGIQLEFNE